MVWVERLKIVLDKHFLDINLCTCLEGFVSCKTPFDRGGVLLYVAFFNEDIGLLSLVVSGSFSWPLKEVVPFFSERYDRLSPGVGALMI